MSRNNDYTTGNLLVYSYYQKYCKIIGTDLSKKGNTNIPKQINFMRKLKETDETSTFFIAEKQQKTILNFSLDSLNITE